MFTEFSFQGAPNNWWYEGPGLQGKQSPNIDVRFRSSGCVCQFFFKQKWLANPEILLDGYEKDSQDELQSESRLWMVVAMPRNTNQRKQSGSCLHPSGKTSSNLWWFELTQPELRNDPTVCVGLETMASMWQHISTVLTLPLRLHGLFFGMCISNCNINTMQN